MRIPRLPVLIAAVAIPVLAGGAIAVANSVSTRPGPQVIIPARGVSDPSAPTTTPTHRGRGADDPAGHDANDDHGHGHGHDGATTTSTPDHRGPGADDPAGHDANDDHGHDGTTVTTTPTTSTVATTSTTVPDDRGHDGPGHDPGDDHGHDGSGTGSDGHGGGPGRG